MSSCEDSDVEEERPDVLDDALKDATGWVELENASNNIIPKLSIRKIHQYFIKRKVRKDQVTASKPFERGYCIYDAKKVQSISIYQNGNDDLLSIIKARVLPSQKTDRVYQTFIVVYKTSGDIYYATCTCTAGEGGSCNHVLPLMLMTVHYLPIPLHAHPSRPNGMYLKTPRNRRTSPYLHCISRNHPTLNQKTQDYHHHAHLLAHIYHM